MPRTKVTLNKNKGFLIQEPDGTNTWVLAHWRGDFSVEQTRPGEEPVLLTTYSNSGSMPFAIMTRFCLITGARLPRIPLPTRKISSFVREQTVRAAHIVAGNTFPIGFAAELAGTAGVSHVKAHLVRFGKEPRLEMRMSSGKYMSLSAPVVHRVLGILPRIAGEGTEPFILASKVLVEANSQNRFAAQEKWETRPRQRLFRFAHKKMKERWKKIATKRPKPRR